MTLPQTPAPQRILAAVAAALLALASPLAAHAAEPSDTAAFDASPGEGFEYLGKIQPRSASKIEASNWSVGAETMDRDFTVYAYWKKYLGPLGVKKARIQSGWAKTEKEQGKYDWAWMDEIVSDMVAQGVEPWVCICYGNPIYPDGGGTGLGGGLPTSDEALAGWDRYVAALVDRYKDRVDEWEIWNEPSLRGTNKDNQYAAFLVRTAEVVRHQQPEAKILACAMAGIKLPWVEQVLGYVKDQGKLGLIDQLTYHPYSYNPDDSYEAVLKLRDLVQSFSKDIMIRQGENGAPSQPGSFGALAKYDWTEEKQAKWALRRLLGDRGRDIPTSYFAICDMQYPSRRNFKGLLAIHDDKTVDHRKEAYFAVQNLTAVFDDSVRRVCEFDVKIEGTESEVSVFGYTDAAQRPIVTLWRSGDRPGARPEAESVTVTLPGMSFDNPVWVDLRTGKVYAVAASHYSKSGDATTFHSIPIYDSVILLADRAAIPLAAGRQ